MSQAETGKVPGVGGTVSELAGFGLFHGKIVKCREAFHPAYMCHIVSKGKGGVMPGPADPFVLFQVFFAGTV